MKFDKLPKSFVIMGAGIFVFLAIMIALVGTNAVLLQTLDGLSKGSA